MIAHIQGILIAKQQPFAIVNVAGISYEVELSLTSYFELPDLNQPVGLHTHLHVREDAWQLFGFTQIIERSLFRKLIKISGIGPKVALGVLSNISPTHFVEAIFKNDVQTLVGIPGIGKKTAQRLMIEIKDHLQDFELTARISSNSESTNIKNTGQNPQHFETSSALVALGYKHYEIEPILTKLVTKSYASTQDLLREALQQLGQKA